MLIDFHVTHCGDDLELIMTHNKGIDNKKVHGLAWDVFCEATEKARELGLYGAGQDMLCDAFSGNVKGMGPGIAEMEFTERKAEPIIALPFYFTAILKNTLFMILTEYSSSLFSKS